MHPRRVRFLFLVLAAVLCSCSGDSTTEDRSESVDQVSSDALARQDLNEAETAIVCQMFVDEHKAMLAVPIHDRAQVFRDAANSLSELGPKADDAAGLIAADLAASADAIIELNDSILSATPSLGFEQVSVEYTRNGLFVTDGGDWGTLRDLPVPAGELDAMYESTDAVFEAIMSLCASVDLGFDPGPEGG